MSAVGWDILGLCVGLGLAIGLPIFLTMAGVALVNWSEKESD